MQVLRINYHSPSAKEEFFQSLKNTGFAVLTHHPLDNSLVYKVQQEWKDLFNSGCLREYEWINATQEGYAPFRMENAKDNPYKNLMEFYNVYPWSIYPNEASGEALKLHNNASRLATTLLSWIDECLPQSVSQQLSEPLSHMVQGSPNHLMRIIHYPPIRGDEHPEEIRAAAHADSNLITILPAPSMPGLQAQDLEGEWHAIDYTTGDLVINIGDMMNECTQDYLKATVHRVVNPAGEQAREERMSTPIFIHPRDEVRLSDKYTAKAYSVEYLKANGVLQERGPNHD